MTGSEALLAILLGNAPLAAQVGDRVHFTRLPSVVKGRPYVNLQVIDDPLFYLHGARVSTYRETFLQADCWGDTYGAAFSVAEALISAVSAYRGSVGGVSVRGIWITGQRDLDGSLTGGESQLFRRNVDFKMGWQTE